MNGVIHVRREVRSLGPADKTLAHYADAVGAMWNRPESEQTSWLYQAAIHGTYTKPELPGWNNCTHNTWFFVAWHRIFVYYFEQIVRSVVEELHGAQAAGEWALPYWNYCPGGTYATLPDIFRQKGKVVIVGGKKTEIPNPLYVAERDPVINAGGTLNNNATESTKALACPLFIGKAEFGGDREKVRQFGKESGRGVFELTPHGTVHDGVGGPVGWMSDIRVAAKDPIFWLHHCNIDRIWSEWIARGEGRQNPAETDWLEQSFPFYDALGNRVSMSCEEVVDTLNLKYEYDSVDGAPPGSTP
jgi:tyrosinase